MKELFILSLWITFLVVRPLTHIFHDRENYGTLKDSSKTLTGYLRRKTRKDIHHIHLGGIILFVSFLFLIQKWNLLFFILSGIGTSLILDQIFPLMNLGNYFEKKMLIVSVGLHLLISITILYI